MIEGGSLVRATLSIWWVATGGRGFVIPFIIRRLVQFIPTILLSSFLIFIVISLAPGDFLSTAKLNPNISPEIIAQQRENLGLDKPVLIQYFLWMKNIILHADFGISFAYTQPVWNVMIPRIINSLWLVLFITILYYGMAVPLGVFGAVRQNSFADKAINVVMYFLLGFPSFFLALLAIFFILQLRFKYHWQIPLGGMTSDNFVNMSFWQRVGDVAKHLIIPAFIVAIHSVATLSRVIRGQMLEVLHSDYIRTARAKGVTEHTAIWKHTFKNGILPFVANIGGELPALIGGAGFVEVVFAYPGITPMLLDALNSKDLYLIAGFNLMTTILLIIGNILADILLVAVDPRVRLE